MNWPLFWALFTLIPLTVFGVAEYIGRKGNTFSETIRRWLGVDKHPWYTRWAAWVFSSVLIGFTCWFVPHILLSIWPG